MTTRVLPIDEWPRLAGTLLEAAWPTFDPARTTVIVVERDGQIVACTAKPIVDHVEGTWVAPAERCNPAVGRRLLNAIRLLATDEVWMMALTDENRAFCERVGHAIVLDATHYAVKVKH